MVGVVKRIRSVKRYAFIVSNKTDYFLAEPGDLQTGEYVSFTGRRGKRGWYATNVHRMKGEET